MKLKYMYKLFLLLALCIISCKEKSRNTEKDLLEKQDIIEVVDSSKENEAMLKSSLDNVQIKSEHDIVEDKKLIVLGGASDYYFENPNCNIIKFLNEIDSILFYNLKSKLGNDFDTISRVKPNGKVLAILTEGGYVNYKIKPFSDYGYEGEEYKYKGVYKSINAYVVSKRVAEGAGYDFIASSGKTIGLNGFPYLSNNGKLIFTCRVDAENIVCGFVKIYDVNCKSKGILWEGWSDYSLLPIEAVWESDTTVLLKAKQYQSENDYYEQKLSRYIYGRLTIQN